MCAFSFGFLLQGGRQLFTHLRYRRNASTMLHASTIIYSLDEFQVNKDFTPFTEDIEQ